MVLSRTIAIHNKTLPLVHRRSADRAAPEVGSPVARSAHRADSLCKGIPFLAQVGVVHRLAQDRITGETGKLCNGNDVRTGM